MNSTNDITHKSPEPVWSIEGGPWFGAAALALALLGLAAVIAAFWSQGGVEGYAADLGSDLGFRLRLQMASSAAGSAGIPLLFAVMSMQVDGPRGRRAALATFGVVAVGIALAILRSQTTFTF